MTYLRHKISQEVLDEVESITGTLSCNEVFYSDSGAALILADDGKYIISVEPNDSEFNNGNPTTHSAYLANMPVDDVVNADPHSADPDEYTGWSTGWEC